MLQSNLISGLIPDISDGYGVTFRDLNSDGYPDIYLVCFRNLNRLLINNGGIIPFVDRTIYSGLGGYLMPQGQINLELGSNSADFDNDGKQDIFVSGWGKTSRLFNNLGDVSFRDVTDNMNLNFIMDANQGVWIDINNDNFLDLYITDNVQSNRLFLNQKNGVFQEVLWTSDFTDTVSSQSASAADFNHDGYMDIYVANWAAGDYLLKNSGNGLFTPVYLDLPTLIQQTSSNSSGAGDIDNDGDPDLVIVQQNGKIYHYENISADSTLIFKDKNNFGISNITDDIYGVLLEDFDNDGWLDCFLTIRGENRLYLNDGTGNFHEEYDTDSRNIYSTGAACADLDNDGDLDIFVANKNAQCEIYLNPTNNQNSVSIKVNGVKSNRDGIGTKIYFYHTEDSTRVFLGMREVKAQSGYLSSSDLPVLFGLGDYDNVDAEIYFPSGIMVENKNIIAGSKIIVNEYGETYSNLYILWQTILFYMNLPMFWLNFSLFIFYLFLFFIFIITGIRRYQWQISNVTVRLIIWFAISLLIFLIWRTEEIISILLKLNIVFFILVIGSLVHSEYILSLKQKRLSFRSALETLNKEMINIHENRQLFLRLINEISKHDEIGNIVSGIKTINEEFELIHNSFVQMPKVVKLCKEDQLKIFNSLWLLSVNNNLHTRFFSNLALNIIIPVKSDTQLLAFIALQMNNYKTPLNQDDLRFIVTIVNQIPIALQNNKYLKESEDLVKKLTEAEVREKYLRELEKTNEELDKKNAELTRLFSELQEKESQLIHSEKMASLGQLVAGISHELNNPISFIYANSKALEDFIDKIENLLATIKENATLKQINHIIRDIREIVIDNLTGAKSVKELVIDLKNFSRIDQAEWKKASIKSGIESSLRMLQSQIKGNIRIVKHYKNDPLIYCNPGQLNQVFINILSNAIQAIEDSGEIEITTEIMDSDWLKITISDTGKGIKKEYLSKIFDPFFTTKDVNEGTGLGLSISHSIIDKHQGRIEVKSREKHGTTFTIFLPLKSDKLLKDEQ
ncbi:MAG: VCBS repeat-containing protein [Calditrichaceae bacterium]|nr:VCBS repeat-containing protein [Calditrichaceae bacterium]MBN2709574.1 VCBS repeat-containing protein [Calditrichaceae bacterium]